MRMLSLLLIFAFSAVLHMPSKAEAFECPEHFKKAGAMIDEATKALKSLKKGPHFLGSCTPPSMMRKCISLEPNTTTRNPRETLTMLEPLLKPTWRVPMLSRR